jgi:hypothetical protein
MEEAVRIMLIVQRGLYNDLTEVQPEAIAVIAKLRLFAKEAFIVDVERLTGLIAPPEGAPPLDIRITIADVKEQLGMPINT